MTDQLKYRYTGTAKNAGPCDTTTVAHIELPAMPPPQPPNDRGNFEREDNPGPLDQKVAFYKDVRQTIPCEHPPLRQLLQNIKRGEYSDLIKPIRDYKRTEDSLPEGKAREPLGRKRQAMKLELPAFSISCDADSRAGKDALEKRAIRPTGIIQVDIDHLSAGEVEGTRQKLESHPSVAFVFKSPSGGLKAGVCIDGAGVPAKHKEAFKVASGIISKLTGHEMDRQTSDFQRLCYMSNDPNLYLNETPEKLRCGVDNMNHQLVTKGLIEFDRHHSLLCTAIKARRSNKTQLDIRIELNGLAARCTREIPEHEIDGIIKWVGNNIDPETQFDISDPEAWPKPTPLPIGLPPVMPLQQKMMPQVIWDFVIDIADRMQCPIEYPAIAVIVALSSVIGRQVGIRPKQQDDWVEVCNLWGLGVGPPGVLKTPSTKEAMRPLFRLEQKAKTTFEREVGAYDERMARCQPAIKALKAEIEKLMTEGKTDIADKKMDKLLELEPNKPVRKRYIVNDPTVEKLLEIMADSPNGQAWIRDELAGLFRNLDKKGRESDRAFLLECWNGQGAYSTDRIGRGNVHVDNTIVSIFGTIQPEPLAQYLAGLSRGGAADDGFMQRFQLALWPDISKEWRDVDRIPDDEAREAVNKLFQRLVDIQGNLRGGEETDGVSCIQFSSDAQSLFSDYRSKLEHHLRSGHESPAMETHLSKFRGLIPRLALVFHLCQSDGGSVGRDALERALRFARCLESHARRIYTFAEIGDTFAAHRLADKIREGALPAEFSAREVYRNNWSGLGKQDVELALDVLVASKWIARKKGQTRGRPQYTYAVNPKLALLESNKVRDGVQPESIWPI